MKRIFLLMSTLANAGLLATFLLGLQIGDASALDAATAGAISLHFQTALGAALLAMLVHSIVLIYFMGTGRWIEETCAAYRFAAAAHEESTRLKYRAIPVLVLCLTMLIATEALGAAADPGSSVRMSSAAMWHFVLASTTLGLNLLAAFWEYQLISQQNRLVERVYAEVLKVRAERGLDRKPQAATDVNEQPAL